MYRDAYLENLVYYCIYSIIVFVIIEMHGLCLVEDCIISHYYHLVRGDYSTGAEFQSGYLMFCQCFRET